MSMWYELAVVLILKDSVWPDVTLICVAKPWMEGSPAPFTCQSLGGSPGSVFSQAIRLAPHGVGVGVGVGLGSAVTTLKLTVTEVPLVPVPPEELHGVTPNV